MKDKNLTARLGELVFSADGAPLKTLARSRSSLTQVKYSVTGKSIVRSKRSVLKFMLRGVLYPEQFGTSSSLTTLEKVASEGGEQGFSFKENGVHKYFGKFIVDSYSIKNSIFNHQGNPQKIGFTVGLIKSGNSRKA